MKSRNGLRVVSGNTHSQDNSAGQEGSGSVAGAIAALVAGTIAASWLALSVPQSLESVAAPAVGDSVAEPTFHQRYPLDASAGSIDAPTF
jgi:hypothetical protein